MANLSVLEEAQRDLGEKGDTQLLSALPNQPVGVRRSQESRGSTGAIIRTPSNMEREISDRQAQIASELRALGRRLSAGDESELLVWIIPNELAWSHRPLRYHRLFGASTRNLAPEAAPHVREWAEMIAVYGIQGIICLMPNGS